MEEIQMRQQILNAIIRYSPDPDIQAGMLAGISFAAAFLAKQDGSRWVTPNFVLNAAIAVAENAGLKPRD